MPSTDSNAADKPVQPTSQSISVEEQAISNFNIAWDCYMAHEDEYTNTEGARAAKTMENVYWGKYIIRVLLGEVLWNSIHSSSERKEKGVVSIDEYQNIEKITRFLTERKSLIEQAIEQEKQKPVINGIRGKTAEEIYRHLREIGEEICSNTAAAFTTLEKSYHDEQSYYAILKEANDALCAEYKVTLPSEPTAASAPPAAQPLPTTTTTTSTSSTTGATITTITGESMTVEQSIADFKKVLDELDFLANLIIFTSEQEKRLMDNKKVLETRISYLEVATNTVGALTPEQREIVKTQLASATKSLLLIARAELRISIAKLELAADGTLTPEQRKIIKTRLASAGELLSGTNKNAVAVSAEKAEIEVLIKDTQNLIKDTQNLKVTMKKIQGEAKKVTGEASILYRLFQFCKKNSLSTATGTIKAEMPWFISVLRDDPKASAGEVFSDNAKVAQWQENYERWLQVLGDAIKIFLTEEILKAAGKNQPFKLLKGAPEVLLEDGKAFTTRINPELAKEIPSLLRSFDAHTFNSEWMDNFRSLVKVIDQEQQLFAQLDESLFELQEIINANKCLATELKDSRIMGITYIDIVNESESLSIDHMARLTVPYHSVNQQLARQKVTQVIAVLDEVKKEHQAQLEKAKKALLKAEKELKSAIEAGKGFKNLACLQISIPDKLAPTSSPLLDCKIAHQSTLTAVETQLSNNITLQDSTDIAAIKAAISATNNLCKSVKDEKESLKILDANLPEVQKLYEEVERSGGPTYVEELRYCKLMEAASLFPLPSSSSPAVADFRFDKSVYTAAGMKGELQRIKNVLRQQINEVENDIFSVKNNKKALDAAEKAALKEWDTVIAENYSWLSNEELAEARNLQASIQRATNIEEIEQEYGNKQGKITGPADSISRLRQQLETLIASRKEASAARNAFHEMEWELPAGYNLNELAMTRYEINEVTSGLDQLASAAVDKLQKIVTENCDLMGKIEIAEAEIKAGKFKFSIGLKLPVPDTDAISYLLSFDFVHFSSTRHFVLSDPEKSKALFKKDPGKFIQAFQQAQKIHRDLTDCLAVKEKTLQGMYSKKRMTEAMEELKTALTENPSFKNLGPFITKDLGPFITKKGNPIGVCEILFDKVTEKIVQIDRNFSKKTEFEDKELREIEGLITEVTEEKKFFKAMDEKLSELKKLFQEGMSLDQENNLGFHCEKRSAINTWLATPFYIGVCDKAEKESFSKKIDDCSTILREQNAEMAKQAEIKKAEELEKAKAAIAAEREVAVRSVAAARKKDLATLQDLQTANNRVRALLEKEEESHEVVSELTVPSANLNDSIAKAKKALQASLLDLQEGEAGAELRGAIQEISALKKDIQALVVASEATPIDWQLLQMVEALSGLLNASSTSPAEIISWIPEETNKAYIMNGLEDIRGHLNTFRAAKQKQINSELEKLRQSFKKTHDEYQQELQTYQTHLEEVSLLWGTENSKYKKLNDKLKQAEVVLGTLKEDLDNLEKISSDISSDAYVAWQIGVVQKEQQLNQLFRTTTKGIFGLTSEPGIRELCIDFHSLWESHAEKVLKGFLEVLHLSSSRSRSQMDMSFYYTLKQKKLVADKEIAKPVSTKENHENILSYFANCAKWSKDIAALKIEFEEKLSTEAVELYGKFHAESGSRNNLPAYLAGKGLKNAKWHSAQELIASLCTLGFCERNSKLVQFCEEVNESLLTLSKETAVSAAATLQRQQIQEKRVEDLAKAETELTKDLVLTDSRQAVVAVIGKIKTGKIPLTEITKQLDDVKQGYKSAEQKAKDILTKVEEHNTAANTLKTLAGEGEVVPPVVLESPTTLKALEELKIRSGQEVLDAVTTLRTNKKALIPTAEANATLMVELREHDVIVTASEQENAANYLLNPVVTNIPNIVTMTKKLSEATDVETLVRAAQTSLVGQEKAAREEKQKSLVAEVETVRKDIDFIANQSTKDRCSQQFETIATAVKGPDVISFADLTRVERYLAGVQRQAKADCVITMNVALNSLESITDSEKQVLQAELTVIVPPETAETAAKAAGSSIAGPSIAKPKLENLQPLHVFQAKVTTHLANEVRAAVNSVTPVLQQIEAIHTFLSTTPVSANTGSTVAFAGSSESAENLLSVAAATLDIPVSETDTAPAIAKKIEDKVRNPEQPPAIATLLLVAKQAKQLANQAKAEQAQQLITVKEKLAPSEKSQQVQVVEKLITNPIQTGELRSPQEILSNLHTVEKYSREERQFTQFTAALDQAIKLNENLPLEVYKEQVGNFLTLKQPVHSKEMSAEPGESSTKNPQLSAMIALREQIAALTDIATIQNILRNTQETWKTEFKKWEVNVAGQVNAWEELGKKTSTNIQTRKRVQRLLGGTPSAPSSTPETQTSSAADSLTSEKRAEKSEQELEATIAKLSEDHHVIELKKQVQKKEAQERALRVKKAQPPVVETSDHKPLTLLHAVLSGKPEDFAALPAEAYPQNDQAFREQIQAASEQEKAQAEALENKLKALEKEEISRSTKVFQYKTEWQKAQTTAGEFYKTFVATGEKITPLLAEIGGKKQQEDFAALRKQAVEKSNRFQTFMTSVLSDPEKSSSAELDETNGKVSTKVRELREFFEGKTASSLFDADEKGAQAKSESLLANLQKEKKAREEKETKKSAEELTQAKKQAKKTQDDLGEIIVLRKMVKDDLLPGNGEAISALEDKQEALSKKINEPLTTEIEAVGGEVAYFTRLNTEFSPYVGAQTAEFSGQLSGLVAELRRVFEKEKAKYSDANNLPTKLKTPGEKLEGFANLEKSSSTTSRSVGSVSIKDINQQLKKFIQIGEAFKKAKLATDPKESNPMGESVDEKEPNDIVLPESSSPSSSASSPPTAVPAAADIPPPASPASSSAAFSDKSPVLVSLATDEEKKNAKDKIKQLYATGKQLLTTKQDRKDLKADLKKTKEKLTSETTSENLAAILQEIDKHEQAWQKKISARQLTNLAEMLSPFEKTQVRGFLEKSPNLGELEDATKFFSEQIDVRKRHPFLKQTIDQEKFLIPGMREKAQELKVKLEEINEKNSPGANQKKLTQIEKEFNLLLPATRENRAKFLNAYFKPDEQDSLITFERKLREEYEWECSQLIQKIEKEGGSLLSLPPYIYGKKSQVQQNDVESVQSDEGLLKGMQELYNRHVDNLVKIKTQYDLSTVLKRVKAFLRTSLPGRLLLGKPVEEKIEFPQSLRMITALKKELEQSRKMCAGQANWVKSEVDVISAALETVSELKSKLKKPDSIFIHRTPAQDSILAQATEAIAAVRKELGKAPGNVPVQTSAQEAETAYTKVNEAVAAAEKAIALTKTQAEQPALGVAAGSHHCSITAQEAKDAVTTAQAQLKTVIEKAKEMQAAVRLIAGMENIPKQKKEAENVGRDKQGDAEEFLKRLAHRGNKKENPEAHAVVEALQHDNPFAFPPG